MRRVAVDTQGSRTSVFCSPGRVFLGVSKPPLAYGNILDVLRFDKSGRGLGQRRQSQVLAAGRRALPPQELHLHLARPQPCVSVPSLHVPTLLLFIYVYIAIACDKSHSNVRTASHRSVSRVVKKLGFGLIFSAEL